MRSNGCAAMRAYTSSAAVREIACAAARVCVRTAMCARVAAQMRAWGGARLRPRRCRVAPAALEAAADDPGAAGAAGAGEAAADVPGAAGAAGTGEAAAALAAGQGRAVKRSKMPV